MDSSSRPSSFRLWSQEGRPPTFRWRAVDSGGISLEMISFRKKVMAFLMGCGFNSPRDNSLDDEDLTACSSILQ
ncbi:hypothetical protein PanWU01x14_092900 [Parasponia andersonii]|uniref:Uncharacterized protein n=1 Tax=Parasponia andersonii TaxID=3476 RepID=A0A2P5D6P1_PARAD|nr:hypothetical protein PanWU01x14_092900 [Parasponia andersonii]